MRGGADADTLGSTGRTSRHIECANPVGKLDTWAAFKLHLRTMPDILSVESGWALIDDKRPQGLDLSSVYSSARCLVVRTRALRKLDTTQGVIRSMPGLSRRRSSRSRASHIGGRSKACRSYAMLLGCEANASDDSNRSSRCARL